MNPRQEASERLGGAYEVRVLEPSPPAVTDPPWLADDPTARGNAPSGTAIVSPVTTGDVTWDELCRRDPELRDWCADRWLGAWRRLPPPPESVAATRAVWHTVAEHVLSPARRAANGKIGLRFTRRGFGTPWFRDGSDDVQARVEGDGFVVHRGAGTSRATITTLRAAAELAGIEPGASRDVYEPSTPLEPNAPLSIDPAAAGFLGAWFGFGASVLEQLRAEASPDAAASRLQLWPEHFDLSVDLGDESSGRRGTFGASPGDAEHPEPYLYVTHWADAGDDAFWNDPSFGGASLALREFLGAPDQRAAALEFFRRGTQTLRHRAATP